MTSSSAVRDAARTVPTTAVSNASVSTITSTTRMRGSFESFATRAHRLRVAVESYRPVHAER